MKRNQHIQWILKLWKERLGLVLLLFFLTLLSSAVAVLYPYLAKLILDTLQTHLSGKMNAGSPGVLDSIIRINTSGPEAVKVVTRLSILLLIVGAGGFFADLFPGIRAGMNALFAYILRKKYFGLALSRDYSFFSMMRQGDILTRLTEDISDDGKLAWFLCSGIFRAIEAISKISFCIIAMMLLDPTLTALSLIPVPLMISIFWYAQSKIYDSYRHNQEAISKINSQLELSFSGVRIIKSRASEQQYGRFFRTALASRHATEMEVARLDSALRLVYQNIEYFAQAGIIVAGGIMAVRGQIGIGTFYAFYTYLGMLVYPMLDIPQLLISGKRSFANIDRLEEIASAKGRETGVPAGMMDNENQVHMPGYMAIDVQNISFTFADKDMPTLRDISFSVHKGERVAVMGPVGCGKTTLLRILAGVLPFSEGTISIAGLKQENYIHPRCLEITGYVPQEAFLFSGTIRENIAFGTTGTGEIIKDGELEKALQGARVLEEVIQMEKGVETPLGSRGTGVSGGQRQRLAIARALARNPEILLLDDITASLDASNEELLINSLAAQISSPACLIVSHRMSTLRLVDKVMFLSGGRILGFDTHSALLDRCPEYATFMEAQQSIKSKETEEENPDCDPHL